MRFDTVMEAGGLDGLLTRLFVARLLGPVYADELQRLERYAQAHPTILPGPEQVQPLTPAPAPAPA